MNKPETPKVLIVYELNPEEIQWYLVDQDHKMVPQVRRLNNKLVNAAKMSKEEEEIAEKLSNWLSSKAGKAAKTTTPIRGHIVEVIHTGFVM